MPDIVLVTMPWDVLATPSLALGILQRLLRDNDLEVRTRSFKLAWMDYMLAHQTPVPEPITLASYGKVANLEGGVGEWIFAEPPISTTAGLDQYAAIVRQQRDRAFAANVFEMRRLAPAFLDRCAEKVLADRPRIVGFTTTFCQNMASLALARRLKEAAPDVRIVFGGANCEGVMGEALHRSFHFIDVVVRGEGEHVVPPLFRALLDGTATPSLSGLCYRDGGRQIVVDNLRASDVEMDSVPTPDFDDYFSELTQCSYYDVVRSAAYLSVENARGCWWGAKSHCTFCGLNGATMQFRSKSPRRALDDMLELAKRHRVLNIHAVDNILDLDYLGTILPKIAQSGLDLELAFEVKANLKKSQLQVMHAGGIRRIQPGIESLSTPILKLMRKGVTAWQNVRLLKWCAQLGIRVDWNFIYGFPREPEEEYGRMASVLPALTHLPAPNPTPLALHRYSPYFNQPAEHGIEILGPRWYYPLLYDVDAHSVSDIAYEFSYEHADGRTTERYAGCCLEAIDRWVVLNADGASLSYRRGPGFLIVRDQRAGRSADRFRELTLVGVEADVYLACDDGAHLSAISQRTGLAPNAAREILDELARERLVYVERDHYLGLAVSTGRNEVRTVVEHDDENPSDLVPLQLRRQRTERMTLIAGEKK